MEELDQLLQELSVPKPVPVAVASVAAPEPVAQPQRAGFQELDDLMAELGSSASSTAAKAPAGASAAPSTSSSLQSAPKPANSAAATVDDLLAELSTPSATSSTKSAAPAAKGGRNDLDNLLNSLSSEMGQIGMDSEYKGQCWVCKKPVIGEVVTALGKTFHKEHFACLNCRTPLGSDSFFDRDSSPYCERCFHDLFAPRCAYCNGTIKDRCVNALNKTWHFDHFFCSQCGKNLSNGRFLEKDGKAYCEEDYFNMFAPRCGACDKPIMADCLNALGRQWHPQCFVCMECHQPFSGTFFDHEGKPYCETHFNQQKGSLCASCQKPIVGRCVVALQKRYHPEHFVCAFCTKQLAKGTFKDNEGKPYCTTCFTKLFG